MKQSNDFKFFAPVDILKKGKKEGKDVYFFRGKASDATEDSDGHSLPPEIFDFSEFKYINWDHGKGPGDIIGEKIGYEIKNGEVMVDGLLYPELPKGKETIDLMKALQKSPNGFRLGMSVEGQILEKDLITKVPTKAKVTSIALCPFPKNGNTWAELLEKSKKNEPLYQQPEELQYEKPSEEDKTLLNFFDEEGNSISISEDFEWKVEKAQSTENSKPLMKEDVESTKKKLISVHTLVKAHQAGQISDEILEKVKEKAKKFCN